MSTTLRDQAARDRFQQELDRNFCVSAGAGVGKTTAIVGRITAIAREDPEALGRLVVVTYANAAAEELKVRAQSQLFATGGPGRSAILPRFRQAFFGTVHSFCVRLLREFGEKVGIPPDMALLEPGDEDQLWARFCESPTLDSIPLDRATLDAVLRFLSFDDLLNLARKISATQAEKLIGFEPAPEPQPEFDFSAALADPGVRAKESTSENQRMLRRFLDDFAGGAAYLQIPQFTNGAKGFKEAYQLEMYPFAAWLDRQAALLASRISLGFREYRRARLLMTYEDQVAWCRRLLDDPKTLEALRRKQWVVLLDEAQDTDAQMFEILTEIARPGGADVGEWPSRIGAPGPELGRFCFVGDEQQAIFASRADIGVYRHYVDAFRAGSGGESLEFSVTMRCPDRVIGLVNAVFFAQDRLAQTHFSFRELHAKPACEQGAAWLLPIQAQEGGGLNAAPALREECRQVAKFLAAYGPRGLGVEKWSEIAILCPRRKWLRIAAEAFIEAGLPVRLISRQRQQLELPERSWPAALLHVLTNPWDRFELIGILRELFAVSDVDLADAQATEPLTFWSERGLSRRLASALGLLQTLHEAAPPSGPLSLAQYVDHVLDATCLAARLEAAGNRTEYLAHLRHEALQAELAGTPLRAFVAQLVRKLRQTAPRVADVDDEIPMLTSHAAKGLEWPVVIPVGLAHSIKSSGQTYPSIDVNEGEVSIHFSKITVTGEQAEPRAKAHREVNQRLFYVTLTRAKNLLIIPDSLRLYKNSRDSYHDICSLAGIEWQNLFSQIPPPPSQA